MRASLIALVIGVLAGPAAAEEIESVYTDLVQEEHCSVFASAENGDGDWVDMACAGYRGYPVVIRYSDQRESVFYGFPADGDASLVWESFDAFNASDAKVEWRVAREEGGETPFATIHRWSVSDADDPEETIEVLVVEKVGLIGEGDGCAVAYVVATGNEGANERARLIADTQARDFACGDQPTMEGGEVPVPSFSRGDN
ncbi:hypothetical protein [Aquamicrobium sp. LC103]|uniref:hypothetical protein n=1 Tax=Aquamicrobium sp. LC103 TaxID=1120658 RepID=UPI00063ECF8F|nr:hypothetical protein [Aquamicrobium sp. LC103]TKT82939.1 hypothetical protein XW59_002960 [Aquamicrobium sp. LC103]